MSIQNDIKEMLEAHNQMVAARHQEEQKAKQEFEAIRSDARNTLQLVVASALEQHLKQIKAMGCAGNLKILLDPRSNPLQVILSIHPTGNTQGDMSTLEVRFHSNFQVVGTIVGRGEKQQFDPGVVLPVPRAQVTRDWVDQLFLRFLGQVTNAQK